MMQHSSVMRALLCLILVLRGAPTSGTPPASRHPIEASATCFLTGERVSGMNKICYYECVAGDVAITVSAVALCPLSLPE